MQNRNAIFSLLQGPIRYRVVAFSIIEVVIALAIFSFGFLAVIGTMPLGLSAAKDAANTMLQTQIVKQVSSTLQESPYPSVISTNFTLTYTRQGYPTTDKALIFFTVTGKAINATDSSAMLPSSVVTTNLALIKLVVTTVDHTTNYYSTVIPNLGVQ